MMGTIAAQIAADTLRLMLSPWSLVVLTPLVVAWVAAYAVYTAPEGAEDVSTLDAWDNGLAHTAGPLCSVLGCASAPVAAPHGWEVCEDHRPIAA